MSMLDALRLNRLKDGLARTREGLLGGIGRLFGAVGAEREAQLDELESILLSADMGSGTVTDVMQELRTAIKAGGLARAEDIEGVLRDSLARRLPATDPNVALQTAKPLVIMVVGINGAGKTTTVGKLAHQFVQQGKRVVIGAADTFRAAANEQLDIWAQRAGAEIIRQQQGADPAAVAFDAIQSGTAHGADVIIIDTAGRLHTKVNLMEELRKIKRVVQRHSPAFPHDILLVIDAPTGQNGLQQARQFGSAVGVTGVVLTKLDGTAKGGIVFSITRELGIPVKYIGVGEQIDDLQPFDRQAFIDALFSK
jgi:fused signal recognition particle receptor